jgi:AcrR family transcriptional regulator
MADRREHIIKMATIRIAKFGFEATTVRQIADDVNILSGSLYHHFATKDEILHEVVKDAVSLLRNETLRIAQADADPETKVVSLVMLELGELVQNHQVHAILYNERKLLRGRDEFANVRVAKQESYRAWRAILEAGMAIGKFNTELDLYQTIRTITRMLNSAADWFASGDETLATVVERYTFEQVETFYLRFILGAVRDPRRALEPIPFEAARRLARRAE